MKNITNEHTDALALLRRAVGDNEATFRAGQWEAIVSLIDQKRHLLLVQRPGWGKSSVYFIATSVLRSRGLGITFIVSPLIALIRNQCEAAKRRWNIRAESITGNNTVDWYRIKHNINNGNVDVLFITPEQLVSQQFSENHLQEIIDSTSLFVVDEAHCMSGWVDDYRIAYLKVKYLIESLPNSVPILCTTATAQDKVIEDIKSKISGIALQRGPLTLESLELQTMRVSSKEEGLAWLKDHILKLPGTGIIYTLKKRDTSLIASWLKFHNVSSEAYYTGIESAALSEEKFLNNQIKVLVATNALGVGYDKPDLKFVIHYGAPGSLRAYYQQVGRAGRAIQQAVGLMMLDPNDVKVHGHFWRQTFPHKKEVNRVLDELHSNTRLTIGQLTKNLNIQYPKIRKVLTYLSLCKPPLVREDQFGGWYRTSPRVAYPGETYKIHKMIMERERAWREVLDYVDHKGCLMEYICRNLDDRASKPCGKCASCLGQSIIPANISQASIAAAVNFTSESEIPFMCHKNIPKNAFPLYQLSDDISPDWRADEGCALSRWKDDVWGTIVADDKRTLHFRDELVDVSAKMINKRWLKDQSLGWVTCIPSINKPNLVPSFAERLAFKLNIPFQPVIIKIRGNAPQKLQETQFHRCKNLDGVFEIQGRMLKGPVLLVDDVVDSRWTLTVGSVLLRRAGSDKVYPFALATSPWTVRFRSCIRT